MSKLERAPELRLGSGNEQKRLRGSNVVFGSERFVLEDACAVVSDAAAAVRFLDRAVVCCCF